MRHIAIANESLRTQIKMQMHQATQIHNDFEERTNFGIIGFQ